MDFTVWKDVCIGSLYALCVLVFMLWLCRSFWAKQNLETVIESTEGGDTTRDETLEPRHKVFLSHSGAQKNFVEQLCVDLERCDRYPFFDRRWSSLPIGRNFPDLIFEAIEQCEVGVVVLSEQFFTISKWPMLELVAMTKNPKLVIIPVFLGVSLEEFRDPKHQKRWLSVWRGWARKDERINIKEWCGALKALGPLNSLINDRTSKVSFREKIVRAVCDIVLPETRWNDSHVQGRSRLAKVVCKKINKATLSKKYGIPVVGLYGVGGIGKTTICQTLCNKYLTKMQGRVFHAELGSASDLELFQGALKSLTDKSHDVVCGLNMSQCQDLLKREMRKQPIFLAIDNMSDSTKSIEQAKTFLTAGFDYGSIVVVTARSLEVLKLCHLDIDENNCLEMPELYEDEAKALFREHALCDDKARAEVDDEIIERCLKRCYFRKGDGKSHHYHPLALKVLGTQLGCNKYDRKKWETGLNDLDTFNRQREVEHPIFSILRKSFDILLPMDRMLFMDVALFLPDRDRRLHDTDFKLTWFEWLSMVHGTSVHDIMERLEGLKRKSLLQDLGDGRSTKIEMHDLWREFAVIESKVGEFEGRRWVYEAEESSAVEGGTPSGGCWQNMKGMCFLGKGLMSLQRINFDHFSNIIVIKLVFELGFDLPVLQVLDVSGLKHLKSLELDAVNVEVAGLGSVENLQFLKLCDSPITEAVIDNIGHLTNLRVLVLTGFEGEGLPDVCKLIHLEVVNFEGCREVATTSGFSSRLSKLETLDLSWCLQLSSSVSGVGDLVALRELSLYYCVQLEELPNLQKLTNLRKLKISSCRRFKSVPGLDDLVALEELSAAYCRHIVELPNVQKLTNLRILDISNCGGIESVPGLGELVSLQELKASHCSRLAEVPDMRKLTNLQVLDLRGCPLESVIGMGDLIALQDLSASFKHLPPQPDLLRWSLLRRLHIMGCSSPEFVRGVVSLCMLESLIVRDCTLVYEVPDCQNLKRLKVVEFDNCEFKDVSGLSGCAALEKLKINGCRWLEWLPDMHKLARLKWLFLERCAVLRDVLGIRNLSQLEGLTCGYLPLLRDVPDLRNFPRLRQFSLDGCAEVVRLACTGSLGALQHLFLRICRSLKSVPDMSQFPQLSTLRVQGCGSLMELTCTGPLAALEDLDVIDCLSLASMVDLSNFQRLKKLELKGCGSLTELGCSGPLAELLLLDLCNCPSLKSVPDMSQFPQLSRLRVEGCGSLMELTCTGPLAALEALDVFDCLSLASMVDLSNFQRLKRLELKGCGSLTELGCSGPLASLLVLNLRNCPSLKSVPDMSQLPQLLRLSVEDCGSLMELTCSGPLAVPKALDVIDCQALTSMIDLINFQRLKKFELKGCGSLTELGCSGPLAELLLLDLCNCPSLKSVPDMSQFPQLSRLRVEGCGSLMELTCTGPLAALEALDVIDCLSLASMVDLSNFQRLKRLELKGCGSLTELGCSGPLAELLLLDLCNCPSLKSVPDMSQFPQLSRLRVEGCGSLMELTCTGPLAALEALDVIDCLSLASMVDLSNFQRLKRLELKGCESLTELACTGPLAELRHFTLRYCRSLKSVPDMSHFPQVSGLSVEGCGSLM